MDRDDVPYRGGVVTTAPSAAVTTQDEADYSTLRAVYLDLKSAMDDIDKWHAFDLEESDKLSLAQQILAHKKAFEMVAPVFSAIESALELVDKDFIAKQRRK